VTKAFSKFYDALLPELPGCPLKLVDHHLLMVARDVCERSSCWLETFPDIPAEVGVAIYYLPVPEEKAELVAVRELRMAGDLQWRAVDPPTPPRTSGVVQEQPRFPVGKPPFSVSQDREQITLIEPPTGDLSIVGTMRPTLDATVLPDVLYLQTLEAVRMGVLSRLLRMGGKPWTDRDLAVDYETSYNTALNAAASDAAQGNTRSMLRTRPSAL
jgi:hypothetical protein